MHSEVHPHRIHHVSFCRYVRNPLMCWHGNLTAMTDTPAQSSNTNHPSTPLSPQRLPPQQRTHHTPVLLCTSSLQQPIISKSANIQRNHTPKCFFLCSCSAEDRYGRSLYFLVIGLQCKCAAAVVVLATMVLGLQQHTSTAPGCCCSVKPAPIASECSVLRCCVAPCCVCLSQQLEGVLDVLQSHSILLIGSMGCCHHQGKHSVTCTPATAAPTATTTSAYTTASAEWRDRRASQRCTAALRRCLQMHISLQHFSCCAVTAEEDGGMPSE